MAKIAYLDPKNLRPATRELLSDITAVVEDLAGQGYVLTLRQLYYQLVTKNILANKTTNYSKLSTILKDARMCGQIDWATIEDRLRIPKIPAQWDTIQDGVLSLTSQFRLDRHEGQDNYVEVWVEKDALSGILEPITDKYHVRLMVNRGYSSVSAMQKASVRFDESNRDNTILYLGDHDPSGLDMDRDIKDRLYEFGVDVEVKRIALTMEQIEKYSPPPNPTKFTDPRSSGYQEEYGDDSWELDALTPKVLDELVSSEIEELIDMEKYDEIIVTEEEQKEKLQELADSIE